MLKEYHKPFRNLYDTLAASAEKYPGKAAIIDDKGEMSYLELKKKADELAVVLKVKYHLQEQDQIAILMVNSADAVAVFYAAMKIGCIALMINTKFREEEIENYLRSMAAKLIFSDSMWLDKIEGPAQRLGLPKVLTELTDFDRGDAYAYVTDGRDSQNSYSGKTIRSIQDIRSTQNIEDTAVIMHTSGTTGKPKGVMVTHHNILEAAYGYQEVQKLDENAVTVLSVPLFHILGLSCVTTHFIYMGATVVLSPFYRVEDVIYKIQKYKATHFHSVPTIYLQIIESKYPNKDLSSLKTCVCGGAPISREHMDAFCKLAPNATLHLAYGMTETAGSGTLSAVHKGPLMACPNVEMMVVDAQHRPLPPGEIGELVFCGPCIARGRWDSPSLPDDKMYSGDVGYMDEEGHVFVIDRLKDIINRGGEKIFPIQVEDAILQYPGIEEAAVYAVSSEEYGEVPVAAIITKDSEDIDTEDLRGFLKKKMATYEVPVMIKKVKAFPVTQNGKVRKLELRRMTEEGGW